MKFTKQEIVIYLEELKEKTIEVSHIFNSESESVEVKNNLDMLNQIIECISKDKREYDENT